MCVSSPPPPPTPPHLSLRTHPAAAPHRTAPRRAGDRGKADGSGAVEPERRVRVIKDRYFRRYFHGQKGVGWGGGGSSRAELQLRVGSAGSDLFTIPFFVAVKLMLLLQAIASPHFGALSPLTQPRPRPFCLSTGSQKSLP